nr:putative RNA-directed DNA polymerase [Tanacetum cinerariifolium]
MLLEFKQSMMKEFEMSDLGQMKYFLGIEVKQTDCGIHISQHKYVVDVLKRFNMSDCNPVINHIVPGSKLYSDEGPKVDVTLFKQIVGSLMYITTTRPDIQYVVNLISRFSSNPTETHFAAAKRVL